MLEKIDKLLQDTGVVSIVALELTECHFLQLLKPSLQPSH
jgi:hypothetical protein